MASKFITNQDLLVSEMMDNILPSTKEMSFLLGYFYFSGFEQIYKSIGHRPLKILVGMDVERDIAGVIREYDTLAPSGLKPMTPSRANVRERFGNAFVSIVNGTDHFDTEAGEAAFRFFLEKIRDGSLEIRKTIEPNHAKLYLFAHLDSHSQNGHFPGTVLTGSSNLTYSGLTDRHEVNVVLRDSQANAVEASVMKIQKLKERGEDSTAWEAYVDRLVYDLYDLTEEEIAFGERSIAHA